MVNLYLVTGLTFVLVSTGLLFFVVLAALTEEPDSGGDDEA